MLTGVEFAGAAVHRHTLLLQTLCSYSSPSVTAFSLPPCSPPPLHSLTFDVYFPSCIFLLDRKQSRRDGVAEFYLLFFPSLSVLNLLRTVGFAPLSLFFLSISSSSGLSSILATVVYFFRHQRLSFLFAHLRYFFSASRYLVLHDFIFFPFYY